MMDVYHPLELSLMSRHMNRLYSPDDFFSHQALELTYRLLRNNNAPLADAVKNTMNHLSPAPYEITQGMHTGEMHFSADVLTRLSAHTIGKIVLALTEIGKLALEKQDFPGEHIKLLRSLIDDWVQLTEWILRLTNTDKSAYH